MTRIFAYGLTEQQGRDLKKLTDDYGFELLFWEEKDLPQKVGYLLGEEEEALPAEDFQVKSAFLLFENLPRDKANPFLDDLREQVDYFPYKANVTATNKTWRLYDLIEHNMEEHRIMSLYGNLMKVSAMAKQLLQEHPDPALEQALQDAEDYLQPGELAFEELRKVYNHLAMETNRVLKARLDQ